MVNKIFISIQSLSDVITNSSSEVFIIDTVMSEKYFKKIWFDMLEAHGYDLDDRSCTGSIDKYNDTVTIDFGCMCNLGWDIRQDLQAVFGEENVIFK